MFHPHQLQSPRVWQIVPPLKQTLPVLVIVQVMVIVSPQRTLVGTDTEHEIAGLVPVYEKFAFRRLSQFVSVTQSLLSYESELQLL